MLLPFENLPNTSRIWIYQTDRNLTSSEVNSIQNALNEQVRDWAAHGAPLAGSYQILYNRFIIIAADEAYNATSGCSIDASTGWLKALENELNINFFDRSITYLKEDGIKTVDFLQVKNVISEGEITPKTLIFNNLVSSIADFHLNWKIQAEHSWLKKYFTAVMA